MCALLSDRDLEYIKLRKLRELRAKHKPKSPQPEQSQDPFAIVKKKLVGRGEEVLYAAYNQHPQITKNVLTGVAKLIESGRLNEPITGELLYELFQSLGYSIRLETKIIFKEHGKTKSVTEKLKDDI